MPKVTALSDASVLFGAQRYFDRLHRNPDWQYQGSFQERDDELLFLELLHNLCLYDRIVMDQRPIEDPELPAFGELKRFIATVNRASGSEAIAFEVQNKGDLDWTTVSRVQQRICAVVASYVHNGASSKIETVKIPWSYHQPLHRDRDEIGAGLGAAGLDDQWLPFTLFVWRAIWYSALARVQAKTSGAPYAYVAAPGRIAALKAILDADDIASFEFPREAVRALSWDLPESPSAGYAFSRLKFASPFETSALAAKLLKLTPADALAYAVRYRDSSDATAARRDWSDMLLEGGSACAVGTTVIQIMRDVTAAGDATQIVRLRGLPSGDIS